MEEVRRAAAAKHVRPSRGAVMARPALEPGPPAGVRALPAQKAKCVSRGADTPPIRLQGRRADRPNAMPGRGDECAG
jgi:hypothetical protein